MKRILLIFMLLLFAGTSFAQVQQGIVKTRGRVVDGKVVPGKMLSGATITLSLGNPQVSQAQGTFSFNVPAGKSFSLVSAKKQGYTLADPEYTRRTFKYSAGNPFYVVLEDEAQRQADIKEATDKVRKTLKRELRKREDELDELRESNAITQAKYDSLRMEFATYRQSSEALVNEMAQRFAAIDYDQLDEFNRQVQQYIEKGELQRADSMIQSKGTMKERSDELDRIFELIDKEKKDIQNRISAVMESEKLASKLLEDFVNDCFKRYEICWMRHANDSAIYWLNVRASKDSTNMNWQYDLAYSYYSVGNIYWSISENPSKLAIFWKGYAIDYYRKALPLLKKIEKSTDLIDDYKMRSVNTIIKHIEPIIVEDDKDRKRIMEMAKRRLTGDVSEYGLAH